jgi:membrane-associated protein
MVTVLTDLLHPLLDQSGFVVYLIVGALVFAEAGVLFGFIFPGETAVLLGGVIAGRHHVSLEVLIAVVVICAIAGDSTGYWVGQRYGSRVLRTRLFAKRKGVVDYTKRFLNRRGAWAVFIARFTAFLRAMVPGLAGMSDMHYRTFFPANALGGVVWGTGYCLLGYAVGGAYSRVEKYSSWASWVLLGLIVAAFVLLTIRGRRRERRLLESEEAESEQRAGNAGASGDDVAHHAESVVPAEPGNQPSPARPSSSEASGP